MPSVCRSWIQHSLFGRPGSCVGRALPRSTPTTSGGSMGFPRYRLVVVGGGEGEKLQSYDTAWLPSAGNLWSVQHFRAGRPTSLLVDAVGEAPAAVRVGVSVSRVDEAVLERPADVVSRQTCHRRHHVPGELSHLQGALVLTPPPVVLRPEEQHDRRLTRMLAGLEGGRSSLWAEERGGV